MGRLRVYLKTFDSTGAYDADFTEITDDVMSIGKVSQKLDNSEYDVGILRNSSMNLKIRNDQGTYSEAGARKSIFVFKRIDSIIKITWDGRLYPPKAGFFKAYSGVLGGETEVFKGLLTEVSSVSNIQEQSIDFTIQGFESLFSRVSVPYGSISNGDNISDVIYACLNQSAITDLLTVSLSNITPDNDYVIDDKSDLENKTVEEALKSGLLLSSNSVLYIENDIVYVTDRDAYSASVEYSFFGQASTSGIENIIDIKKYREGINRVFNFITWPETSLSSSDATSQETYGIRKKEVSTEKGDTLLQNIADEAYVFQTLDNGLVNYDPFLFYGFTILEQRAEYGFSAKILQVEVTIIMAADPSGDDETHKLLRYSRVLQELFEKNWNKVNKRVKLKVTSLEPIGFSLVNSSQPYRAIGVYLEGALP